MSPAFIDNDGRLDWRKVGYHARAAFAVLLAASVLIGGGWFVYDRVTDAYTAWRTADDFQEGEGTGEPVEVLIPMGAGVNQIGDILVEAGVVKSVKAFRSAAQDSGQADQLAYGRYNLVKQIPAEQAFNMLLDTDNLVVIRVTFPEGTPNQQQWDILANTTERKPWSIPMEDIQIAAASTDNLPLPEYAEGNLEGFLYPSTYNVAEPPNASWIMASQLRTFDTVAQQLSLEGRAEELGFTPLQVVTVASIVAREVSAPADQPMVAGVIYNRLEQGMKLQMDSTVHFVKGEYGQVTTTPEDRAIESPYNTYWADGLPPGPISNPGRTALEAALQPAQTDALFFVTVNLDTGETRFAATAEEHAANVALFQEFCRGSDLC